MTHRRIHLQVNRNGFTVIEVVVATVIIAIVLMPLVAAYFSYHQAAVRADAGTAALLLAQDKIEEIKNLPYPNINNIARTPFPGHEGYAFRVDVQTGTLGVKTITVTAYYPTSSAEAQVVLVTGRARR